MGNVLRSKDDQINHAQTYGMWLPSFYFTSGTTGAVATTTSGGLTMQRHINTLTVPTVDTGLTGWYCTRADVRSNTTTLGFIVGIETNLGSLNMNTGTFTDGAAMPTRTIKGVSTQTAAQIVVASVTTAITATTPTITITYTDQNGNTGNSAAITTGTNPAYTSTYMFNMHLASGDTGITDITAATKSAGSAGVVEFIGLRVIAAMPSNYQPQGYQPGRFGTVPWIAHPGEKIGIYTQGTTNTAIFGHLAFVVDN